MPENNIKENLSKAYVRAICSRAGYSIASDENDFGSDITVRDILRRDGRKFVFASHYKLLTIFVISSIINRPVLLSLTRNLFPAICNAFL